ncbi:MAG: tRNA (guanine(46)-N(7))-methyltransferase TrmB [Chlamydiales bacterium]|jgi:tRNA (guanine-N7-)-methyltransferase|nr:tRNA (guanine(46)-N(7))-methyltransferase TrmB [Chlamydiales bacterium]
MKPKDLKFPFSWDERRPLIFENILFVPQYYENHRKWGFVNWYSPQVFKDQLPIHVEYCSGNGCWLIEKAKNYPEINWIAVEKKFERVRKIWSKMRNLNLTNILIVCGEALTFTKHYVADASFQKVYINFPDPWPKEKHAKNRLLQEPFLIELSKKSRLQTEAIIATDHLDYVKQIVSAVSSSEKWDFSLKSPFYTNYWEDYGSSYFEQLWRAKGKQVYYLPFSKKK